MKGNIVYVGAKTQIERNSKSNLKVHARAKLRGAWSAADIAKVQAVLDSVPGLVEDAIKKPVRTRGGDS